MSTPEELQKEIDRLKASEAELVRKLEELQIIFDTLPIMVWYKDKNNFHIRVNKTAAALEGVPPSAIEGKSAYDLYPREQADAFHQDDLEVIHSGKPKPNIIEKHTTIGSDAFRWVQTGKVPYRNRAGDIIGIIVFATDITEQKQAEEVMRDARDKLEQQNRKLARTHEFIRSTFEQMGGAIERGASQEELLTYLQNIRKEFEGLE